MNACWFFYGSKWCSTFISHISKFYVIWQNICLEDISTAFLTVIYRILQTNWTCYLKESYIREALGSPLLPSSLMPSDAVSWICLIDIILCWFCFTLEDSICFVSLIGDVYVVYICMLHMKSICYCVFLRYQIHD